MSICTRYYQNYKAKLSGWLATHPKCKQWLWFIVLWLSGLITVIAFTYPLRLLLRTPHGVVA